MKITINTYDQLNGYIQLFKQGSLEILILEGSPGTGKTSIVKEAFKDVDKSEYLWIEGRCTAASFYEQLYMYRDCPIILDDADSIYQDKESITLLKTLCQTSEDKKVSWNVKRKLPNDMPYEFYTGSQVLIICNQWNSNNKHISSIEDRGILLNFIPDNKEIHRYAKSIITNQGVYNYFDQYIHIIRSLSLRQYKVCQDIAEAQLNTSHNTSGSEDVGRATQHTHSKQEGTTDHTRGIESEYNNIPSSTVIVSWQDIALSSWGFNKEEIIVIQLLENKRIPSMLEKSIAFKKLTNRSDRTYYRIKKELLL